MATIRRWMYLDSEGIASLHQQAHELQITRVTVTQSSGSDSTKEAKGSLGAWGISAEGALRLNRTQNSQLSQEGVRAIGQLLLDVESFMAANGSLSLITKAADVAELRGRGDAVYVTGALRFRWSSTHDTDPVKDASAKAMVEFVLDREANDDAGVLADPVRMCGSLEKCVGAKQLHDGTLAPVSHLAIFLRQIAQEPVRLGFIAQLQPLPGLTYLKPFAIWFS